MDTGQNLRRLWIPLCPCLLIIIFGWDGEERKQKFCESRVQFKFVNFLWSSSLAKKPRDLILEILTESLFKFEGFFVGKFMERLGLIGTRRDRNGNRDYDSDSPEVPG